MTLALAERPAQTLSGPPVTAEQLELVKRTVANGATPAELQLYLYDCARQGVHPLDKLLHFTKRGGKYTPVTSIDLMRIRAAETNEYAGSDDAVFEFDKDEEHSGVPDRARVTVWRLVQGTRCPFTATARWSEYCPGQGSDHMWRKMPHTMLAKCAEALALRKGFPRQLAGLYAKEEMDQADRSGGGFVVEAPTAALSRDTVAGNKGAAPSEPSVPNGGDSGDSTDKTPQIEKVLPAGTVLIQKVEQGMGTAKGFIHTHRVGESFPVYKDQLVTLAAEVCQNREPVLLELKTSAASNKQYVVGIKRAPMPESWKPFADEPKAPAVEACAGCGLPFKAWEACAGCGLPFKACTCDVPF